MEKRGGEGPSKMCQKEEKSKGRTNDNLLEKIFYRKKRRGSITDNKDENICSCNSFFHTL